ncbi:tetratricopeptide repeat protein [Cyclobacterium jeungdonense]|uniref:Tetratricopeptide repeat protein n=1 Tax=Cyclobacterium jeungdonense TaxID=708087 RepID=A0ABT8C953_9BACT|nr:tetratricopeptide repeat protein [Cyclobacterium jeungdonense]MDN3689334.1 tetratricopeptide repeat protein [Cyclobacterium jeungdonense]
MNMKYAVLIMLLCFSALGVLKAQENASPDSTISAVPNSNRAQNEVDNRIYSLAMRYNDVSVAKIKLYELMERNPRNLSYAETLASLYFEMEQYGSAALVSLDILERNDKSLTGLEVAAFSLEQLGALERALPHFESLHLLSGDLFSLYKTGYLQYTLKKYEEALNSVNMLIKDNKSTEQKLNFPTGENNMQEVSMAAAAQNLKGLIYKDQGSTEEARAAFEEALVLSPEFQLAKENLGELQ